MDRTWVTRGAGFDLDLAYTYDQAGNPVSVVDAPTGGQSDAQCFAYDGLRRLTEAWTPADADCATVPSVAGLGGPAPYWRTYSFDAVGNRTTVTTHGAGGDTTSAYTYPAPGGDGPHQVTQVAHVGPGGTTTDTFAYDTAGNTTIRALDGDPVQTLVWDTEGELVEVVEDAATVGEYLYTADGDRLVRRQGDLTTVYLPGGQELTLNHVTSEVTATRYYAFNGNVVATRTDPGETGATVLVSDPHATAELAVDGAGVLTRRWHDPYGNPRGAQPAWPGDHGFLDKPVDVTGLIAIGARYYDPATGRFTSVDPVMDLTDPAGWHGYAYAGNNPLAYTDPTGLAPTSDAYKSNPGYLAAKSQWTSPKPPAHLPVRTYTRPPVRKAPAVSSTAALLRRLAMKLVSAAFEDAQCAAEAAGRVFAAFESVAPGIFPTHLDEAAAGASRVIESERESYQEGDPGFLTRVAVARYQAIQEAMSTTDWGTFTPGVVNVAWGGWKIYSGVGDIALGAGATATGVGGILGVPAVAYGIWQLATGSAKVVRGGSQIAHGLDGCEGECDFWHNFRSGSIPMYWAYEWIKYGKQPSIIDFFEGSL